MILENAPKFIGLFYAVVVIILLAVLVRKEKLTSKIGLIFLFISTSFGFLFFAPMLPYSFQLLVLRDTTSIGAPLPMAVVGLLVILVLTFVFGRFFCGYICPIGTVQELLSRLPVRQIKNLNKKVLIMVHVSFFILFMMLGMLFSTNMLKFFGFSDFFHLNFTVYSLIFVGVLVISILVYRPFCRVICPYGLLLSIASLKSILRLKRNKNCVDCEICEKKCPTDETLTEAFRQECYLCMRCNESCPKNGISYEKRGV